MAKTKISEYSTTNSDNTDIENINIAEGCAPSGINNAIRELMVHLKEFQTGASGDAFTFAGGTLMSGTNTISGAAIISGNINSSGTNTFSGSNVMSFSGGSSASPSIYFASDTNTGIFSPAADTVAIAAGGSNKAQFGTGSAIIDGLTVGRGAGAVSTNTAVGASALAAVTTGANNSASGYQAGNAIVDGALNTAFGSNALLTLIGNNANSAFGANAGKSTTAGNNTFVGSSAGFTNSTGASNVSMGAEALYSNTTASYNTAVGYQAGYANTTGAGNVFLGFSAGLATTTGEYNTLVGRSAGLALTTGSSNTFVGGYDPSTGGSGAEITTGSNNTIIGNYNGNQGGLDIRTASNNIVLSDGDGNPQFYMASDGVPKSIPTYNNTSAASANMVISGGFAYGRSTSALKYKQDIRDLESMDISLLRPVRYKSKCEMDDKTKDHIGIVADEAAESGFEELVTRNEEGEIEGFQYERLTVVLLKKLQTLDAEFKAYIAAHP